VPAAAVIPAPRAYIQVAAVKTSAVESGLFGDGVTLNKSECSKQSLIGCTAWNNDWFVVGRGERGLIGAGGDSGIRRPEVKFDDSPGTNKGEGICQGRIR